MNWNRDADPNPVDPDDPIFVDRPSFASVSEQVDEMLYGAGL